MLAFFPILIKQGVVEEQPYPIKGQEQKYEMPGGCYEIYIADDEEEDGFDSTIRPSMFDVSVRWHRR